MLQTIIKKFDRPGKIHLMITDKGPGLIFGPLLIITGLLLYLGLNIWEIGPAMTALGAFLLLFCRNMIVDSNRKEIIFKAGLIIPFITYRKIKLDKTSRIYISRVTLGKGRRRSTLLEVSLETADCKTVVLNSSGEEKLTSRIAKSTADFLNVPLVRK